jgi:hypothetical protein
MIALVALIGAASAIACLRRRRWIDAGLVLLAGAALALFAGGVKLPGVAGGAVAIDQDHPPASLGGAASISLRGDGLRAAQWHDLPARPLAWTAPTTDAIRLEFPRRMTLGRMLTLTVRRSWAAPGHLQLLAENGQVLAEAKGEGDLTVQWLPPVAETLVLQARLSDQGGKLVAQGPVPVIVGAMLPLQVQGRFGAPSFDLRVLNDMLAASHALVDWQVTLGKTVTRSETARGQAGDPNLLIIDAAWFQNAAEAARAALLAKVAHGTPLLILAANAGDAALWRRTLQLELRPQPENTRRGAPLAMAVAPLNPAPGGVWRNAGELLWTRPWQKGRIAWLGAADWHRHAIGEPKALALWWQGVIDQLGVQRAEDVSWIDPLEMPVPGQRLEVCAQGVRGEVAVPSLGQDVAWARRPDRADASCVALWPRAPGWLRVQAQGSKAAANSIYVFKDDDWPLWQRAQRRDATERYAARTPVAVDGRRSELPRWPFALVFGLSMLALWWRERR